MNTHRIAVSYGTIDTPARASTASMPQVLRTDTVAATRTA